MPHLGEMWIGQTSPVSQPALGASPATYASLVPATLHVAGGTVSKIEIVRGGTATDTKLTSGTFSVRKGDGLTVTYTVVPTLTVVPD